MKMDLKVLLILLLILTSISSSNNLPFITVILWVCRMQSSISGTGISTYSDKGSVLWHPLRYAFVSSPSDHINPSLHPYHLITLLLLCILKKYVTLILSYLILSYLILSYLIFLILVLSLIFDKGLRIFKSCKCCSICATSSWGTGLRPLTTHTPNLN